MRIAVVFLLSAVLALAQKPGGGGGSGSGGSAGPTGPTGPSGSNGATGATGATGVTGATGATGAAAGTGITSGAIAVGLTSTTISTPSATSTLDSSGNAAFGGSVSSGINLPTTSGQTIWYSLALDPNLNIANTTGWGAPIGGRVGGNALVLRLPAADPTAAKTIMSCPTPTGGATNCVMTAPLAGLTDCTSAATPAVCGSAATGMISFAAGANTALTINTTAIGANSHVFWEADSTLSTPLSVTCNSTLATLAFTAPVTAKVVGTSFTLTLVGTSAVNPVCGHFTITNPATN